MGTIGERIRELRRAKKISVDELAKRTGKNRATIYRYENGDIENAPYSVLSPIADALGTTPAYLMGLEEEAKEAADWLDSVEKAIDILKTHEARNKNLIYFLTLAYDLPPEYQMRILKLTASLVEAHRLELEESGTKQYDPRLNKFLD